MAAITAVMAAVFCFLQPAAAQAAQHPADAYRQAELSAHAQADRTKAAAADGTAGVSAYALKNGIGSRTAGVSAYALTDAGQTLSLYAASDEIEAAYEATGAYLLTLDTPQVGSTYGEWLVLGLARAGIISDAFVQGYAANVEAYVAENGSAQLSSTKSTENSRVILALTSIGYDVTDVAGYNLLEPLADLTYVCKQGVNGMIFALIALDAGDYEIPEAEDGATQTTREGLISAILQFTTEDGGFSFTSGGDYDIDITAMALQGLAPYYGTDEDVTAAVDNALTLFESIQGEDGYFGDDPCTAAQVVTALCTLGIDPATDERYVKNGLSVMDELLDFYLDDTGGFAYYAGKDYNEMATEQAYYALVSYVRLISGQSALYNMTDTAYSTPATGGTDSSTDTSAGSGADGDGTASADSAADTDDSTEAADAGTDEAGETADDASAEESSTAYDVESDEETDEDSDTGSGSDTEEDADTEAAADDIAVASDADTGDRSGLYERMVVFAVFAGMILFIGAVFGRRKAS